MHCDQVFDILTRGPFPSGRGSDRAVEQHLGRCGECRRLAEALRPALELFQEAVPVEESRLLPGYWGNLADAPPVRRRKRAMLLAAKTWRWSHVVEFLRRGNWARAWGYGAALLAGCLVGMMGQQTLFPVFLGRAPQETTGIISMVRGEQDAIAPTVRPMLMGGFHLQPACLVVATPVSSGPMAQPARDIELVASASPGQIQCCTQCHSIQERRGAGDRVSLISQSCSLCHP